MNKRPLTTKGIAKMLNLSVSTVSRALHNDGKISPATTKRVKDVAVELGYEPNLTAVFLQSGKTFTLGIILPDLSDSFFSQAITGIEDYALQHHYNILLGQSHDDTEREKKIVGTMKNHRVDGLLVAVAKNTRDLSHFDLLKKYDMPVVFFGRVPDEPKVNSVSSNTDVGMAEAVSLLVKKGHTLIAFINSRPDDVGAAERTNAYVSAIDRLKLNYNSAYVVDSDLTSESTGRAMQQLLSVLPPPTAVISFDERVALEAIYCLRTLRADQGIFFVTFGNSSFCHYLEQSPLACIEQFPYQQGQTATEILLDILNTPIHKRPSGEYRKCVVDPRLFIHR